jgi:pimeloyl-ACP methyl ester carboxylesterase
MAASERAVGAAVAADRPQRWVIALVTLVLVFATPVISWAQTSTTPETVEIHNGSVTLHALLWTPPGRGPFPAILFNHGSGRTAADLKRLGPYEPQAYVLGPLFARHGYAFLYPFRRGVGLSTDQGVNAVDLMDREQAAHGTAARNALQVQLLETRDMGDAMAGLAFLRARPEIDARDVALIGHSFGGSLTLLMAQREPTVRAVVVFSAAGYSWDRSPELRTRLLDASADIKSPAFFIHAANDYSIGSGETLAARRKQLGRPGLVKIYPPVGRTAEEGHSIPYLGVDLWAADVFAFLDRYMRQ